ncbi:unnamed protein product, partial [Prorocentrum cordatum]
MFCEAQATETAPEPRDVCQRRLTVASLCSIVSDVMARRCSSAKASQFSLMIRHWPEPPYWPPAAKSPNCFRLPSSAGSVHISEGVAPLPAVPLSEMLRRHESLA